MNFPPKINKILCIINAILTISFTTAFAVENNQRNTVEIKDGWFYVNGEKFFVKGACFFENHDVEGKFTRSSLEVLDYEFRKIKEAGFNTIRSQLNPAELALAEKHGLMVMQGANHLFFSSEYKDPQVIKREQETTKNVLEYSKSHNNVLYYIIDNEPQIQEGIYRQGESALREFHSGLIETAKSVDPKAIISMASYPPAAFLDYSIYDCVSLNLYPFCPAWDSIGYAGYAQWFKRKYAAEKPFIISEYGWEVSVGEKEFAQKMMSLLDEQIKAGATGSFFYTWRAFGKEGSGDNLWYGIIPNDGKKDDYKKNPRSIYRDFQHYFEAVIIEPTTAGVYSHEIPFEIYGTDKTGSVNVLLDGKMFNLKRKGKYWWEGAVLLAPDNRGQKTITVIAQDVNGMELVRKEMPVKVGSREFLRIIKIMPEKEHLREGNSYRAKIVVYDGRKSPVSNQSIVLGVNETGNNLWISDVIKGKTNANGEFDFVWDRLLSGYFTVMAGLDTSSKDCAPVDINIIKIDK